MNDNDNSDSVEMQRNVHFPICNVQCAQSAICNVPSAMCNVQCAICAYVYLCLCVFYIWYTGMSYLISLNPMLFKNIAHVGSFKHFVFLYLRICVIVYLCILHLIHGNVIFDILESNAFQKYSTCCVLSLSLSL